MRSGRIYATFELAQISSLANVSCVKTSQTLLATRPAGKVDHGLALVPEPAAKGGNGSGSQGPVLSPNLRGWTQLCTPGRFRVIRDRPHKDSDLESLGSLGGTTGRPGSLVKP